MYGRWRGLLREQVAAHTTPHRVYISGRGVVWVVIFCPAYPMGHLGTRGGQPPVTSRAVTLVFGWIYINFVPEHDFFTMRTMIILKLIIMM